ncbi:Hexose phosphate transport protein UhpT [Klebsiella grimontii]|nr:Hexose phosphate transport protein UhpT [Klebsiella grimontii]
MACVALALIIATLGVYQHASNQYVYLASLFALGFLVFGPQLLIGVAAVGFVPKKAIGAADGIKGTFAYLIGDSFAKLGLGMIADGTPIFRPHRLGGHLCGAGCGGNWLHLSDGHRCGV